MPKAESKVAWITGASKGIGLACAEALAREGYAIAMTSRSEAPLRKAVESLRAQGLTAGAFACDVASESSVAHCYQALCDEWSCSPDVLINNAGISPWPSFSETTVEEFDQTIAINVRGLFLCSRAVLPSMLERKRGAIVQMLSVASIKGYRDGAPYVASKFAALGFTNALREEVRTHGVRVIGVLPGAVETELWDEESRTKFHERMMQPEDVASTIVHALKLPERALVEEILIRPIGGDL